ncbi:bifunctional diguanylate cyclase/phosphodiesterase [Aurantimonas sp. VKM B-3413]|uniref:putative bifunctional diguanylate cyclase/phosphodiesterase n=1 Tax=Aurantimonas sp. VKM B-3413 TaxID=2779401 RepID=UPI001E4D6CC3|nr:EAL domain-containing protein [Aurantimonas sp. VKM B-3413]MCB8838657.1 EAL domain-containing protein [Aurantimonas sp. VKM B-3413]
MPISKVVGWLCLRHAAAEVILEQHKELQRQVPLLYALLCVNAAAVAYTHHGLAPDWMTVGVPLVLVTVSVWRLVDWVLRRNRPTGVASARAQLQLTILLAAVLSAGYCAWSLGLNSYGGAYEHAHVAVFIAVTVIGCIFCLLHLPQAALAVTLVVSVPSLAFYLSSGNSVLVAIGMNMFLVTCVMIQVVFNSFRSFAELIASRGETERLGRENLRLAHTDVLVGLPNRRHFLAELASRVEHGGDGFCVIVLDLDRFKPINDTHGHLVGDRLLEKVGDRLRDCVDGTVLVARLGGDEFGMLAEDDGKGALALAQRVCDVLSLPFDIDGLSVSIGASCGVAEFPGAGATAHQLFDHADYALYRSKLAARGTATLYSIDHETEIQSDRAVEAALRTADLESEMEIHLQPIVDGRTGRAFAVEALARWRSPTLGNVRPDIFICVAERTGLIQKLTPLLLAKALKLVERLPAGVKLSFNLSAHDVTPAMMLILVSLVRKSGVDASRLIIELTETAVLADFEAARQSIDLLRALGVEIALDDFGTGYSSLSYLNRLAVNKVKIDRSFVGECGTVQGRNLLCSILALCSSVDLSCIVEGVEEADQLHILHGLGFRHFQGYYFGRPIPADDIVSWFAEHGAHSEIPARAPALPSVASA